MATGIGYRLEELRARCGALSFAPLPELAGTGGAPSGPGWFSAADLTGAHAHRIDELLAARRRAAPPGPHAVHALRILLRELVFCVAAGPYLVNAAPAVSAGHYWYHAGGPAGIDRRLLVVSAAARVGGPAATDTADVRLPSTAALDTWVAEGFVATVAPIVTAVRGRSRVGPRTLWSYVLDMLHFNALTLARQLGHDRTAAWERSAALAEAVHAAGAPRLSRPALVRFGPDRDEVWGVRGACCLDFKDPAHGMCLTCPLLDADARATAWVGSALRPTISAADRQHRSCPTGQHVEDEQRRGA